MTWPQTQFVWKGETKGEELSENSDKILELSKAGKEGAELPQFHKQWGINIFRDSKVLKCFIYSSWHWRQCRKKICGNSKAYSQFRKEEGGKIFGKRDVKNKVDTNFRSSWDEKLFWQFIITRGLDFNFPLCDKAEEALGLSTLLYLHIMSRRTEALLGVTLRLFEARHSNSEP